MTNWFGRFIAIVALVLTASLGSFAQTHVVMWLSSQPAGVNPWAAEFEQAFNAANPDVRLELLLHPSVSQQREKLVLAVAAGNAPDVVYESSNTMGEWVMNGIATPLDGYLERIADLDDFVPAILEGVRYGGKTYALPFSVWTNVDLYNLDLLNEAGVHLPATWGELEDATRSLTRFRPDGSIEVFGYRNSTNPIFAYIDLERAMEQLGTTTIDPLGNRANMRNDQAQRAMEHLRELYRLGMPGSRGGTDLTGVAQGTVAIQHLAPTLNAQSLYDQTAQLGVAVAFRPIVGPTPDMGIVHHNAGTLFMVQTSPNKEAAWRVMEAWVRPENMARYILAHGGSLPARISLTMDPALAGMPFADQFFALLGERITTYGSKHPLFVSFRNAAGTYLQQAIEDQIGISTALEQAEEAVNQVVRDFRL